MRKLLLFIPVLVAIVFPWPTGATSTATVTVSITRVGFVPDPAAVMAGDSVAWTNTDAGDHQVVSQSAGFASPILKPGESYSFLFKTAGRYSYQDPLVKKLRGSVTVQAAAQPAASLTLGTSRSTVVYGGFVTLSGTVSSGQAGEAVTVFAQAYGQSSPVQLGSATTASGGAWSFVAKPAMRTDYETRWKPASASGPPVTSLLRTVKVRPRVALRTVAMSGRLVTFSTKATAARSFAGRFVFFQRRNAFGQWVSLKKLFLSAASSAKFKARLPRGRSRVRVLMPAAQAGPGYLAGISPVRTITR